MIIMMLALSMCVPNVFVFVESLLKSIFSNKEWPTFGTIFAVSSLFIKKSFIITIVQQVNQWVRRKVGPVNYFVCAYEN